MFPGGGGGSKYCYASIWISITSIVRGLCRLAWLMASDVVSVFSEVNKILMRQCHAWDIAVICFICRFGHDWSPEFWLFAIVQLKDGWHVNIYLVGYIDWLCSSYVQTHRLQIALLYLDHDRLVLRGWGTKAYQACWAVLFHMSMRHWSREGAQSTNSL